MRALPQDLDDLAAANREFVAEARRYGFRYRCESCTHVAPSDMSCSMGYPNHYLTGPERAILGDGGLAFCKYFELGEGEE